MVMTQQRYRIIHEDFGGTTTDITGAVDIQSNEGIESKSDSFKLRVFKSNLESGIDFVQEDNIKIYFGDGNALPSTIVMDGLVKEVDYESGEKGTVFVLKGQNALEVMLSNVMAASFSASDSVAPDGTGWTSSDIIEYYVNHINDFNSKPTWITIGTTEIDSDGDNTLHINYVETPKPVFEHIEALSTNEYTGNGPFVYYLDSSNNLVWKKRSTTPENDIVEEGNNVTSIKVNTKTEIINFLIADGGTDLNGAPITDYVVDTFSAGKYGWKMKYVPMTDISKNVKSEFPAADNETIRNTVRERIQSRGGAILERIGISRHTASVEMVGNTTFVKGSLYTIITKNYLFPNNTNSYSLRLINITHRYTAKSGWTTTLEFEEDEDTAREWS